MVYISLDELLPTSEEYGEHKVAGRSYLSDFPQNIKIRNLIGFKVL